MFPTTFTNAIDGQPGVGTPLNAALLNNLEIKVGINSDLNPASLDYMIRQHKVTEDAISGLVKVNGAGVYSAVTDNSANWNTAFGWGNHAGLYSLLAHTHAGVYDPVGTASGLLSTHESTYAHANIAHGETAYGWGNHAGLYDLLGAAAARQAAYANLTTIGALANSAGWLHNDGAGSFAYSTPTAAQVGATTVGGNLFALTNPSAITFIRINTDNTVSALGASDFRTAIGAGTSSFDGTWGSLSSKPTNVVSFGSLSDSAGWLHNSGTGTLAYSTPTYSDVGALASGGTAVDSDKLDGQHGSYYAVGGAAPTAHNIFSTSHGDTTGTASPVDGDIIIGNVTPLWSKLAISIPAGAGLLNVLGIVTAELRPSWKALFDTTVPTTIAESASAAAGTSTVAAHRDHTHGAPSTWAPTAHTQDAAHGGTGQTVYVIGDFLQASTTTALSQLANVATGSYLASGGIGVVSAWATLNQAAVAGLTTASSPVFVTVKLSGLTDGYIPYHVSDAVGLANSGLYWDGTNVGIGTTNPLYKSTVEGTGNDAANLFAVKNSITASPYLIVNSGNSGNDYQADRTGMDKYVLAIGTRDGATGIYKSLMTAGQTVLATEIGSVLIGATAAIGTEKLYVNGSGIMDGLFYVRQAGAVRYRGFLAPTSGSFYIGAYDDTGAVYLPVIIQAPQFSLPFAADAAGNYAVRYGTAGVITYTSSDARKKKNIRDYEGGLDEIIRLSPRRFTHFGGYIKDGEIEFIDDGEDTIGLVAQEVYGILPEATYKPIDEQKAFWSVHYEKIIPALINSVKTLNGRIKELEIRLN